MDLEGQEFQEKDFLEEVDKGQYGVAVEVEEHQLAELMETQVMLSADLGDKEYQAQ
jgi:hypothetical protein